MWPYKVSCDLGYRVLFAEVVASCLNPFFSPQKRGLSINRMHHHLSLQQGLVFVAAASSSVPVLSMSRMMINYLGKAFRDQRGGNIKKYLIFILIF